MTSTTYELNAQVISLAHISKSFWTLRDEPLSDKYELLALIRSGDYFSVLATQLDEINQVLEPSNLSESIKLQHAVDTLLELQRYYKIVKKD